jgi:ABC-type glycerol-3-phosphate transport system substrate-binding protein
MTNDHRRPAHLMSRRKLLISGATIAGVAASAGVLAACGDDDGAGEGGSLTFWQTNYPPGSAGAEFYEGSAGRFADASGVDVEMVFKTFEDIAPSVTAAANARKGVDVLAWWSGPTLREQARLGNVIELDSRLPSSILDGMPGLDAVQYEGGTYGMTYLLSPYFCAYNQKLLSDAGIAEDALPGPEEDPIDWDGFLEICETVKSELDIRPLMWANKNGYPNEWWFYNLEGQAYDSTEELAEVNLGDGSWQNPEVAGALEAYKELYTKGYFFEGGEVAPHEQHVSQFASGQVALTGPYFDVSTIAEAKKTQGEDAIRFTKVPAHRSDKELYGAYCVEPSPMFVMSFSKNKKAGLQWLEHIYSLEEQNRLAEETGLSPANPDADLGKVKDAQVRSVYAGVRADQQVYPYNFATPAQYDSLLANTILYLQGEWSAEKLMAHWDTVDEEYKAKQG